MYWRPIETAPKDGTVFWCYDRKPSSAYGYDEHSCFWDAERKQFVAGDDADTDIFDISPTRWMPLHRRS